MSAMATARTAWRSRDTPRAVASAYGLAAYVFTRSPAAADRVAARLEAGSVGINQMRGVPPDVGIAGIKDSGYGYEGGRPGIEAFLNQPFGQQIQVQLNLLIDLLLGVAGPAMAHSGDGISGFLHPFTGYDHLLAMIGAGMWASLLAARRPAKPGSPSNSVRAAW